MDIAAIGTAIATRFAGSTPPTGYTGLQLSTSKRQRALGKMPALIVRWEGTRDLVYAYRQRGGIADFTATFYYSKAADDEATDAALQAWSNVLMDRLLGQLQLGEGDEPNRVKGAYIRSVLPGQEQLGDPYYATLEFAIEVEFDDQDISSVIAV